MAAGELEPSGAARLRTLLGELNARGLDLDTLSMGMSGDMEAAIPLSGQVCGRIDEVQPVAEILSGICSEFAAILNDLAGRYRT